MFFQWLRQKAAAPKVADEENGSAKSVALKRRECLGMTLTRPSCVGLNCLHTGIGLLHSTMHKRGMST